MKIGDTVYSTKIRCFQPAVIVKSDVRIKNNENDKKKIQSKYIAEYCDGSTLIFYGFDIGRTVFKSTDIKGQLSIFDYLGGTELEKETKS